MAFRKWLVAVLVLHGALLVGSEEVDILADGSVASVSSQTSDMLVFEEPLLSDDVAKSVSSTHANEALAELLDEELLTLEKSIAYQQKKLEILTALRRSMAAEMSAKNGTSSENLSNKYCVDLHRAMERLDCEVGLRRSSRRNRHELGAAGEEGLNLKARIDAGETTTIGMLSFRTRGVQQRRASRGQRRRPAYSFVQLIALGFANGSALVVDSMGEMVSRIEPSINSSVVAFGFDGSDSLEPVLAVGRADGTVSLANVSLWRDDVVISGRRPRPRQLSNASAIAKPQSSPFTSLKLALRSNQVMNVSEGPMKALGILSRRLSSGQEVKLISVAVERSLRLYHTNGTLRAETNFQEPIVAVERSGSVLGVAHGNSAALVSVSRWNIVVDCEGATDATATALAFDAASPSYLHVAYDTGDLLIFNTRSRLNDKPACKLQHKVPSAAPGTARVAGLAAHRGFLITVDASAILAVHNTTFVSTRAPRYVFSTRDAAATNSTDLALVAGSKTVAGFATPSTEVLVAWRDRGHIVIYESLFRYNPTERDISWMRMPILFIGLIVVFGYQFTRKKHTPSFGDRQFAPGFDTSDPDAILRDFERRRRRRSARSRYDGGDDDDDD